MVSKPIIIIGNGGHAKVVYEVLQLMGRKVLGFTAPEPSVSPFSLPYLGDDNAVLKYNVDEIELALGVGSIGVLNTRESLFNSFKKLGYTYVTLIHPTAIISPTVKLGEGVQIMAGVIIQSMSQIADNTIINTGSIIEHDCIIAEHVHVAPGCKIAGQVHIESHCHIGIGSTIIQGITIGSSSLIGAGAVVIRPVDYYKKIVGVPGREV